MDNETRTWRIVMTAICMVVLTVSGCNGLINHQDNVALVAMVNKGADPLDARCAVKGLSGNACAIRAATKGEK